MNLSQFEVFVTIVDTGSLTEAAEVVGLTQSAVSYSLSRLEAELGVTLLERGRNGVTVTRIGEDVLEHARSILAQVEIVRQKTARERGLSVGKLRFGCVPHVSGQLLAGIIRDFQHKYPDIEVVLFEGTPNELTEWLDTSVIDIGTVLSPAGYPVSAPLVHNEIKVIVSKNHALASQSEVTFERLHDELMIGPKADYGSFSRLLNVDMLALPRLRYEVSNQSTILAMVREDMGISMMPEMLVNFAAEDVIGISLNPRIFINVYIAANTESPATQAFLKTAHEWAKNHDHLLSNA